MTQRAAGIVTMRKVYTNSDRTTTHVEEAGTTIVLEAVDATAGGTEANTTATTADGRQTQNNRAYSRTHGIRQLKARQTWQLYNGVQSSMKTTWTLLLSRR